MLDLIIQQPILAALVALVGLSLVFGALLGFAAEKFKIEGDPVIEQIDELLPKLNADNVASQVADPTRSLLPMAMLSINAPWWSGNH